jgi:hypothetical protein
MVVFFQYQPVLLDEDLQSILSYNELVETLQAATSIPSTNIKLIAKGKMLMLSSATYTPEVLSYKIVMYVAGNSYLSIVISIFLLILYLSPCRIGSTSIPVIPDHTSLRVKDDLSPGAVLTQGNRSTSDELFDRRQCAKEIQANPYRFHALEALSGLHDEDRARELLQLLSTDPGVLAVLKKHKWSVGMLCEMYPEVRHTPHHDKPFFTLLNFL